MRIATTRSRPTMLQHSRGTLLACAAILVLVSFHSTPTAFAWVQQLDFSAHTSTSLRSPSCLRTSVTSSSTPSFHYSSTSNTRLYAACNNRQQSGSRRQRQRRGRVDVYRPTPNSLRGQTIVITGASSGLGLESAKRLGAAGANLILTTRTVEKGATTVATVTEYLNKTAGVYYDDQVITFKVIDFDDLSSIKENVANEWKDVKTIDVLLNNAGIMALPKRQATVDRFEKQMQSNHLGPFVFTSLLVNKLSENARIVNVSSDAHKFVLPLGGLDFDYMWKALVGYNPWVAYGHSKLANILFTQELQRRADVAGRNWTVATLHPGGVATNLGRSLVGGGNDNNTNKRKKRNSPALFSRLLIRTGALKTPAQGASTQVWLAAGAPGEDDVRGKYYDNRKAQPLSLVATDRLAAERLWKESEELGGVEFTL